MLTLAEIESSFQIDYEWQLEALGAPALRALLADPAALKKMIPDHMNAADGRSLAEAKLLELTTCKPGNAAPSAPSQTRSAWDQFFTLLKSPLR